MPFIVFLLGLFLISARPSFAIPAIDFSIPTSVVAGEIFDVNYSITQADIGTTFYLKLYGGIGTDNSAIKTISANNSVLSVGDSWGLFPLTIIGQSNSVTGTFKGKAVSVGDSLTVTFKIADNINQQVSVTKDKNLMVLSPSPTPTVPSNTPAATRTPTPTLSTTPTVTITQTPSPSVTARPTPQMTIESFPSIAHVYQAFTVRFNLTNLSSNTDYYFKGIGGVNDKESLETYNAGNWYGYNDAWSNMPKFTSDSSGRIYNSISMRVKSTQSPGEYKIQVRVKDLLDSDIKYVTIQSRLPTLTPSPTRGSGTPTPTFEPSPTPEPTDFFDITPTLAPTGFILGDLVVPTSTPTPHPALKLSVSRNKLPLIFMVGGGLMILLPIALSFIKHDKKTY